MASRHCSCITLKTDCCDLPQRIDPAAIADTFVYLSQQPKGCWTHGVSMQRAFLRLLLLKFLTYRAGHPSRRREVVKNPRLRLGAGWTAVSLSRWWLRPARWLSVHITNLYTRSGGKEEVSCQHPGPPTV